MLLEMESWRSGLGLDAIRGQIFVALALPWSGRPGLGLS